MKGDLPFARTEYLLRLYRYLRDRGGPAWLLRRVTVELTARAVL